MKHLASLFPFGEGAQMEEALFLATFVCSTNVKT